MSGSDKRFIPPEGAQLGTHVIRFVSDEGQTIDLAPHGGGRFDVEPLDFEQFVKAAESKTPTFPVVITNASAPTSATGLDVAGPLKVKAVMAGNGPVTAYGLVEGGWLPMPWAHKRVALLDRNVVLTLDAIQRGLERAGDAHKKVELTNWLGLDTDEVSPALFGLEGKDQRPPTEFEIRSELGRAARIFARVLPGARVQAVRTRQRKALHAMVLSNAIFRARATRLLLRAAPTVADRAKPEGRLKVEQSILQLAREEAVRTDSLVVLALLSCVYDANPALSSHRAATPGRAVLKPTTSYDEKDAYNALADLFSLELMHNAQALFSSAELALYTRDVGLAALWTATQPCTRSVTQGQNGRMRTIVTVGLHRGLFPALADDEIAALKARIQP